MAFIGVLEQFDENVCSWDTYVERMLQFFAANNIAAARRVPTLLCLIGPKTYQLVRSLTAPDLPDSKTLDELVDILKAHFRPAPVVAVERFRFHKCVQAHGMSVQSFIAELKRLSEHCNFGAGLQEALCDRFVCGLSNDVIQKRLLAEPNLTLQRAYDIAVMMETASRDAAELTSTLRADIPVNMHRMTSSASEATARASGQQQQQQGAAGTRQYNCFRCGNSGHSNWNCRFRYQTCLNCGKQGHIKRVCRAKTNHNSLVQGNQQKKSAVNQLSSTETEQNLDELPLYHMKTQNNNAIMISVTIEGHELDMELDTGSAVSVLPMVYYEKYFSEISLQVSDLQLCTYTGEKVLPKGKIRVQVHYQGQHFVLDMYVVEGQGPPLFGRDWLKEIKVDWPRIKTLYTQNIGLSQVLEKHKRLFEDRIGVMKGFKAKLHLKEGAKPKYVKARPVPYAMRPAVEAELDRLQTLGIITPIQFSDWATPIVPVIKKDGTMRLCGDYRVTVNPCLDIDKYPLPIIDEMFASLSGGNIFSKIDLTSAYQQIEVDEETANILTISTHKGLFRMNRLAFGVASVPAIFQRAIEQVSRNAEGTLSYLDDILVEGHGEHDHLNKLDTLLSRLEEHDLAVNLRKCDFFVKELEYMGHIISGDGLKVSDSKVEAMLKAPAPENVTKLRSFLGMVNYYSKFLPNLASVLKPLHELLEKDSEFSWGESQQNAFQDVKEMLASTEILTPYDPTKEITLACDASEYGVGAVLSHRVEGVERPVAYASRTLTKTERAYAQVEKEALALIFGIKKFHVYLSGRKFSLITDHQPLVKIFGPKSGVPVMAAARMQRWSLLLGAHQYQIVYRSGSAHGNADALSRLPLDCEVAEDHSIELLHMAQLERLPVTPVDIARETRRDTILSQVYTKTSLGWNDKNDDIFKPYYLRRNELTIQRGCLLWGLRVVMPRALQSRILEELHGCHTGIVKMKAVARSYVWWPTLDADLEHLSGTCEECLAYKKMPALAPLHPWTFPEKPWTRVHIDYAGPFQDVYFLVLVDAFSKWPEVIITSSTTAEKTIDCLRSVFARFGLPEQLVSDNGTQFTSDSFAWFLKQNGIKHIRSSPYHPATNGLAERFIQTLKIALSKDTTKASLQQRLCQFLFQYRTTIHTTTQRSPAELLLQRIPRTRLDLLRPAVERDVQMAQINQTLQREKRAKERVLEVGDTVLFRDFRPGSRRWDKGTVSAKTGPVSFEVVSETGRRVRRHQDHLHRASAGDCPTDFPQPEERCEATRDVPEGEISNDQSLPSGLVGASSPVVRASGRLRRAPQRLTF